jgi:hypothetical protein
MDIIKFIAGTLDYLNDSRKPKFGGIRDVHRVVSYDHSHGYSFIYEACLNDEWKMYGPDVQGNFSVRSDLTGKPVLPSFDDLYSKTDTRTIGLGWYALDDMFHELPLEDLTTEEDLVNHLRKEERYHRRILNTLELANKYSQLADAVEKYGKHPLTCCWSPAKKVGEEVEEGYYQ